MMVINYDYEMVNPLGTALGVLDGISLDTYDGTVLIYLKVSNEVTA